MQNAHYVLISLSAWTGAVHADHVSHPPEQPDHGRTIGTLWHLPGMLACLVEGGFLIDKRPLADDPGYSRWVLNEPLCNGRLSGSIDRLSPEARQAAAQMGPWMGGEFRRLAVEMAASEETTDGSPGPFDRVPADVLADYWRARGARIGKRIGDSIQWSDGSVELIEKRGDADAGH